MLLQGARQCCLCTCLCPVFQCMHHAARRWFIQWQQACRAGQRMHQCRALRQPPTIPLLSTHAMQTLSHCDGRRHMQACLHVEEAHSVESAAGAERLSPSVQAHLPCRRPPCVPPPWRRRQRRQRRQAISGGQGRSRVAAETWFCSHSLQPGQPGDMQGAVVSVATGGQAACLRGTAVPSASSGRRVGARAQVRGLPTNPALAAAHERAPQRLPARRQQQRTSRSQMIASRAPGRAWRSVAAAR